MRGLQRLKKEWVKLYRNLREMLGIQNVQVSSDVRKKILGQLEASISVEKDRKVFPFRKIVIRLQPPTKSIAREFNAAFMENSLLKSDAFRMLKDARIQFPPDLEISLELQDRVEPGNEAFESTRLYEMEFGEPVNTTRYEIPEILLEIIKGSAEQSVYRITKDRLLVGCLSKVQDREGRLVRINNVVFPDTGNEINATVGDMHARIWFDFKRQEYRVMDESSLYGTRIVREGHTIEVPPENPRGVGLRSGDEIYFGQACLRFRLMRNAGQGSGSSIEPAE
ncbi:MAG: FHA domain-containing protein [Acidobacteria bacterium]|nr:FHA domain-containing protein [Acidobacteriota bacterium]